MAGLGPAIHVLFLRAKQEVDARDERGMTTEGSSCHFDLLFWPLS
jgi:hypothetical protein